jgi:hypothetical protein
MYIEPVVEIIFTKRLIGLLAFCLKIEIETASETLRFSIKSSRYITPRV